MRWTLAVIFLALTVQITGCGGQQTSSSSRLGRSVILGGTHTSEPSPPPVATSPSRPSRPGRPASMLTPWPNDVRINTLVSNHGVSTAGEPGIAAVADGAGGTFIAWEDSGGGVIRTQRLDAAGNKLWPGGVVSTSPAYQASPSAVSDGSGGWFVAWIDGRNGSCDSTAELSCALFIQRVGPAGLRIWGDDGLQVSAQARYPSANRVAVISDGAGGAYIAWSSGTSYYNCCSFYMQSIGPDGQTRWAANGVRVSELPSFITGPGITGARLVPDQNGGAIISWWNQQTADGSTILTAQRIDPSGNLLWPGEGVQVPFTGAGHANFDAASDGTGGVVFAVQSNDIPKSSNTHVYLQRVSADGEVMWGETGVQVSPALGAQITPSLVADGEGGAFVSWAVWDLKTIVNNHISVQHVDTAGTLTWSAEAKVTATSKAQTNPHILADGGGVIVAWEDCRTINSTDSDCIAAYDIYAQRIDSTGKPSWTTEGLPITFAKANQGVDYGAEKRPGFEMIPDGNGGVVFLWPDGRLLKNCAAGLPGLCDLYAQHLAP